MFKKTFKSNGYTISVESTDVDSNPNNASTDPSKTTIEDSQLGGLVYSVFKDRVVVESRFTEDDVKKVEGATNFTFNSATKRYLMEFGKMHIGEFKTPSPDEMIKMTAEWNKIAKTDQKDKYVVVESDDGDYTIVDNTDTIYVYEHETENTVTEHENTTTHIAKHIMCAIIGSKCKY